MTKTELRNHSEYEKCMTKIRSYPNGFVFAINFSTIPTAKANALKIVLHDACDMGLLESIAIGLSITGEFVQETFKRVKCEGE